MTAKSLTGVGPTQISCLSYLVFYMWVLACLFQRIRVSREQSLKGEAKKINPYIPHLQEPPCNPSHPSIPGSIGRRSMEALNLRASPRSNQNRYAQFTKKKRLREKQKNKVYQKAKLGFKPRVFVALYIGTHALSLSQERSRANVPPMLRSRGTAIPCFQWLYSQWLPSFTCIGKIG